MRRRWAIGAAVLSLTAAAGTAGWEYRDTLLEPLRAEAVHQEPSTYWPPKNTLQADTCRYWLGFGC